VLQTDHGTDLTKEVLTEWITSAQKGAGLKTRGGLHILRHTFCSHLAMTGAPAMSIKELAGHANLSTTMRYMHLSPGAKEDAIRLLDLPSTQRVETCWRQKMLPSESRANSATS
jgi:site-specific recombinase XerD